jgi:hypothetical protein
MTAIWGPMGWMTLHSISVNYPENPSFADKAILKKFLDLFADTISCPSCKGHFSHMYRAYILKNPTWADSRYNLFLFVVRAHNTVNKRIDKPRPGTVFESLVSLREATKNKTPAEYRANYLTYLMKNWAREGGGEGFIQCGNVREMQKINNEYWNLRETGFSISFPEADVLQLIIPVSTYFSPYTQSNIHPTLGPMNQTMGFTLKGGKFSFGPR